jgi:KTSC domain
LSRAAKPSAYRASVDLAHLSCQAVERSFIHCLCYDSANAYMIVQLDKTYYHYCGIDNATVEMFKAADSMGRFFNASIKGHFDCRTGKVPAY